MHIVSGKKMIEALEQLEPEVVQQVWPVLQANITPIDIPDDRQDWLYFFKTRNFLESLKRIEGGEYTENMHCFINRALSEDEFKPDGISTHDETQLFCAFQL